MKYTPTPNRPEDLLDVDAMADDQPLPAAPKVEKSPKKPKGPSPFNLRANNAFQNFFLWAVMATGGWLLFPLMDGWVLASEDPWRFAAMTGAAGFGLGAVMLRRADKSEDHGPYGAVHSFLFISLGLSLLGYIPETVMLGLIGPLLLGFGSGSFCAVIYGAITTPVKQPAPVEDKESETSIGEGAVAQAPSLPD
jgi:hypothetical protein